MSSIQVTPTPSHALSFPSHILIFLAAPPRLTDACLIGRGHGVFYPPPDSQEIEPRMLPPYGHAASPRSLCFSPLDMPHYLFTHLWNCVDAIGQGVVGALGHGVDRGHGTGPWDDVRRAVVDRPTLLQPEFWPHPSHTIYTSIALRTHELIVLLIQRRCTSTPIDSKHTAGPSNTDSSLLLLHPQTLDQFPQLELL